MVEEMRHHPESVSGGTSGATTAKVVYILLLASVLIGLTSLIGVIIAYINRSDAPAWLASHYRFQIRTFWIGLLYLFCGILLSGVGIGWLIIIFWAAWLIIRCAKGIKYLDRGAPPPDPATWLT